MNKTPLDRAIQEVGGLQAFATALGLKPPSVIGWKNRKQVPALRCIAIETLTHGAITRYELRADVFGEAPSDLKRTA